MVKLQKSLTKTVELGEKKKKKVVRTSPPLAGVSKVTSKRDKQKQKVSPAKAKDEKKEKLIKGLVKENEVLISDKKKQKIDKKQTEEQLKNVGKISKNKNTTTPKKPLVLAPPISPTPVKAASAKLKNKLKVEKKKERKTTQTSSTNTNQQQTPLSKLKQKSAAKRKYKKEQIIKRREGKTKKIKKVTLKSLYEAPPFDEDKFNSIVNEDNVKKITKGLKKQVEKEVSEKKTAIFSDFQYFLNIACFKIPNVPKRVVKLNLKHSLVDKEDDIAIIVADLQRGAKIDYDPTIQHYEDIFREAGVEGLTIIPFNKLRNECKTFESVRKFGNTYDYFLCDGRLVGHASGFCGKIFQKPRTTFHSVRMDNKKNLKREIEKSLKRTAYKQLHKGDLISIPIGSHKFTEDQLAENVMFVMEQLKQTYPGGLPNIRSMYLKISIAGTTALPIYVSVAEAPAETPNAIGPREKRMVKLKREANEVLTTFKMTKTGEFIKLTKSEVARKRKLMEMRKAIEGADSIVIDTSADDDKTKGKQSVVPAKKAKTEKSSSASTGKAEKEKEKEETRSIEKNDDDDGDGDDSEAEQEGEDEHDGGEDDSNDDEGDDDEEDDDDDDDDDEDGDDDEDDDEEAGDDSSNNEDDDDGGDDDDE